MDFVSPGSRINAYSENRKNKFPNKSNLLARNSTGFLLLIMATTYLSKPPPPKAVAFKAKRKALLRKDPTRSPQRRIGHRESRCRTSIVVTGIANCT
jgi:hypothetical protein